MTSIDRLDEFYTTICEDLKRTMKFWFKHSHDKEYGGFLHCLDATGTVYDDTKYVWMQARQVWMYARLYNEEEYYRKEEVLAEAIKGAEFIQKFAKNPTTGKCCFSLTREGKPIKIQRTIFSECFYTMAMSELFRATKEDKYKNEAVVMFDHITHWVMTDPSDMMLGLSPLPGASAVNSLAVPMMLLCMLDQFETMDAAMCNSEKYTDISKWSIAQVMAHRQKITLSCPCVYVDDLIPEYQQELIVYRQGKDMENILIREATLEDKADVIDIHDDVYDGRDYLASRYEEFLSCPNTTSFVALVNDKIVAFLAMLLIDGCQTMVSRAGRSSPAVAKQGVYKKLNAHAQQEARKCGVTINALTTGNMNQAIYTDSFRMQYKEILKKTIVRFLVDIQTVPIPNTDDDVTLLHEPDDKEIVSYFADENTRSYLFPKDRIICSWVPYKLLASNLWHMRRPGTNKHVTSDVRVDDNGRARGLFTISSTFACVDPPYFIDLDIHGTDTKCLKQHVLTHFQFARKIVTGVVSVLVYMEPDFNKTELVKAFAEMGINESPWFINGVELNEEILFENESR